MSPEIRGSLLAAARAAQKNAYAPYSGFATGAAVLTRDGRIFSGACLEAVTMRGIEATQSAIGRMVSRHGWEYAAGGLEITDVVYAVPQIDTVNHTHLPSPEARGFLMAFAGKGGVMTHYATEEGIALSRPLSSLIADVPRISGSPRTLAERFEKFSHPVARATTGDIKADPCDAEKLLMARFNALNPKTDFAVGVLLKTEDGHEFTGCNIEFGPNLALHAEQVACADMVTTLGPQAKIKDILVMVDGGTPWIACPVCINTISEFRSDATTITALAEDGIGFRKKYTDIYTKGGFEGHRVRHGH